MKIFTQIVFLLASVCAITNAAGQANASINILTQNTGIVTQGGTVFLEVTINNTGPVSPIGIYKIKTQISVPSDIAAINSEGHTLPEGWTITGNDGSTIRLTNGTDSIAVNDARTILIAIRGNIVGGPSTVAGQLSFSNGNSPGTAPGTLIGDNTADNSSTSTIQVTGPLPVTFHNFKVALVNCQPALTWVTENEINTDRFDIERGNTDIPGWTSIGVVAAKGNTTAKTEYRFIDGNLNNSFKPVLYRLKIIDKDARYSYSEVLPVSVNCDPSLVRIYPNPAVNGRLYVNVTGTGEHKEATLSSVSGQVISRNRMTAGINYLDISTIANGLYVLKIKDAKGLEKNYKIVIRK